jgi:hypothetical protein
MKTGTASRSADQLSAGGGIGLRAAQVWTSRDGGSEPAVPPGPSNMCGPCVGNSVLQPDTCPG